MIWSYVYSVGACISMRSIDRRPFDASRHPRHCCLTRFVTCGAVIGADELFLLFLLFLSFPRRIWPRYRTVCFFGSFLLMVAVVFVVLQVIHRRHGTVGDLQSPTSTELVKQNPS